MDWYTIYNSGRALHADRLQEAEHARLFARRAKPSSYGTNTVRSRIGQALISLGYWVDGHSNRTPRYEVEREAAL